VGHCVWVSSLSTNRHGGEAIWMLRQTQRKQILYLLLKKEHPNLCANSGLLAILATTKLTLYAFHFFLLSLRSIATSEHLSLAGPRLYRTLLCTVCSPSYFDCFIDVRALIYLVLFI
jgi:hypothetical protein